MLPTGSGLHYAVFLDTAMSLRPIFFFDGQAHSLIRFALALAFSLVLALLRVLRNCGFQRICEFLLDIICLGQVGGQRLARPSIFRVRPDSTMHQQICSFPSLVRRRKGRT